MLKYVSYSRSDHARPGQNSSLLFKIRCKYVHLIPWARDNTFSSNQDLLSSASMKQVRTFTQQNKELKINKYKLSFDASFESNLEGKHNIHELAFGIN